jgi:hypothetical protein
MVVWENYVWETENEASLNAIKEFESAHEISFPKPYIDLVITNQGKTPEPANFKLHDSDFIGTVNVLLHFDSDQEEEAYSVKYNFDIAKEYLPAGIVPFASTINDDLLCFDYRSTDRDPPVILASHEYSGAEAIFPVSKSFIEFIENMYSDEK